MRDNPALFLDGYNKAWGIEWKNTARATKIPDGWHIDKTAGSPLHGYEFITDGKSVLMAKACP